MPHASAPLHVSKLRGIDQVTRSKLKRGGITYANQLLTAAGSASDRQRLATALGISDAVLWHLAARADLARISGIGAIFAEILCLAGFDGVGAIAAADPSALHARLAEINARERFARRAPTADEVADWVRQARALPLLLDPLS
jgi:predicted flap endonuclease-1-like 5' DNA nuclease